MLQLWFFANTVVWPLSIDVAGMHLQANVVLLIFAGAFVLWKQPKIASSTGKISLLLFAFILASLLVAISGPCNDKFEKSVITAPILLALVFTGLETGRRATRRDWLGLTKAATAAIVAAFAVFLLEFLAPKWFPTTARYRVTGRLSGIFQEPSVVAFSLFPCVAVLLVSESRKMRRIGIWALVGLILISRSSTLIALIAAWVLYRLAIQRKLRQAVLLIAAIAVLIGLVTVTSYDALLAPTVDRIAGLALGDQTQNISSLVYLQGWQDAWSNLIRTHGLGLGFNMMGCHPLPDVPTRTLLTIGGMGELNAENGSFQFSKIVSETGILGIMFYAVIVWWWIRLEKKIRILPDNADRRVKATQAALMFCFIVSSFIRGVGYFDGGLFLWLIAMSSPSQWQADHLSLELAHASKALSRRMKLGRQA